MNDHSIPRAPNCGRFLAETNDGRLLYLNHANEWQEMPNILAASPASPSGVLDLYREAVRVDVKMEGPQFMGCNTSALKRAWEADRAALAPATEGTTDAGPRS